MRLISQDGTFDMVYQSNNFYIDRISNRFAIRKCNGTLIACYLTQEVALESMRMMREAYAHMKAYFKFPDNEEISEALKKRQEPLSDIWEAWSQHVGKSDKNLQIKQKLIDIENIVKCIRENAPDGSYANKKLERICNACMPKFLDMLEKYERIYETYPDSVEAGNALHSLENSADTLISVLDTIRKSIIDEESMRLAAEADAFAALLAKEDPGKSFEEICREALEND